MSDFNQLILSLNSRINHEKDFSFSKNNGEAANRIRNRLSTAAGEIRLLEISIDEEGDVSLLTEAGQWYVTEDAVFLTSFLTTLGELIDGSWVNQVAQVFELLSGERQMFPPVSYQIGALFTARFLPQGLNRLRSRLAGSLFESTLQSGAPQGDVETLRFSTFFERAPFNNFVELEVLKSNLHFRCARQSPAQEFGSYREFLSSAQLGHVFKDFRPFIEPLVTENANYIRGRVFKNA